MKGQFFEAARVALIATVGLTLAHCGEQSLPGSSPPPRPEAIDSRSDRPNVVMIVMDTARQDHLSCYGYSRDTTPNLSTLKKNARTYYNAYSTTCWTAPSHASLFTGLFPVAHKTTQENWAMAGSLVTLAEALSEHGYQTYGIIENAMLASAGGYGQGFSKYHETWRYKKDPGGENIALYLFKRKLDKLEAGKPFFIFVNLIEPHNPYDSSRQFYGRFVSDPSISLEGNMWPQYSLGLRQFTEAELRHLNEMYDAELLFVDYVVGRMVDELEARGHWDNTVFIVTSDHGENIGDHGFMDHVFSLYESTTKVPLIIHYPELFPAGSEDYRTVQLTDIFPTVLTLAGIDKTKYPCQGHDLLANTIAEDRVVFCEYYYPKQAIEVFPKKHKDHPALGKYLRQLRSVIAGNMKFIWGSDGKHELYDLGKDPGERINLIGQEGHSDLVQALAARLVDMVGTYHRESGDISITPQDAVDDTTREALRGLGYLR